MKITRYRPSQQSAWSPFDRLSSFQGEMGKLLETVFPAAGETFSPGWNPALDVRDTPENVVVTLELPGLTKEDIQIELLEDVLTVSGERKRESETQEGETFRSERVFGRFERSLALPAAVTPDKVSATYKDGILTVTMPKAEESKPKRIDVRID